MYDRQELKVKIKSGPLAGAEVYDAEVHGAMAALEAIIANLSNRNISAIYVMLDNAEAVQALRTGKTPSSYWRVRRFRRAAEGSTAPVCVKWIPGHEGIPGNEAADQIAREALGQITDTEVSGPLSLASADRKARALAQNLCRDWWDSGRPKRYEDLNLEMCRKKPPEPATENLRHTTADGITSPHHFFVIVAGKSLLAI
ncbi:hypothetical protein K3495_g7919 [Podosphaera aphanis]|nr:hypothetical protein K3495_g7919 [Podosphaera aphanis]